MPQTKATRQAAGKKAAATRKRNQAKANSQEAGKKAAASRQRNQAASEAQDAKSAAGSAVLGVASAAKSIFGAAKQAGKSVASRTRAKR